MAVFAPYTREEIDDASLDVLALLSAGLDHDDEAMAAIIAAQPGGDGMPMVLAAATLALAVVIEQGGDPREWIAARRRTSIRARS